jgi:hypothetical protein
VAASADGRKKMVPACKLHGIQHVRSPMTAHDQHGPAGEHAVEDDSRLVVAGLTDAKQWPTHSHPKLIEVRFVDDGLAAGRGGDLYHFISLTF